jgi:cytochrome c
MTSRSTLVLIASLLSACLASAQPAHAAQQQEPGDPTRGGLLASDNCARCHALGREGDSPNAAAPPFRLLAERYPLENLEEALAEGITVGHEGADMPEFELSPEQIDDLLAFLRRLAR